MIYSIDTDSLRAFGHYYPKQFPSIWQKFDSMVTLNNIISVKEVYEEIIIQGIPAFLKKWIMDHSYMFLKPSKEEIEFIKNIFLVNHFKQLISRKSILQGRHVADPFIIASAYANEGTLVTQEKYKENGARIPNICQYFDIPCINLEEFMEIEEWTF
jgi:hypothetical protein